MSSGRIIGLSGRKESGKTELASICENLGYERRSFATPLKHLVASLLCIPFQDINKYKQGGIDVTLHRNDCYFVSRETDIPLDIVVEKLNEVRFLNTRDALQYIGTDLIRHYNAGWHVNRLKATLEHDKKYVFDDVRFPNEKRMIEEEGGDCWFITRPKFDNVSNHESETALEWQFFDKVIINNDNNIEALKLKWQLFVESGYEASCQERAEYLQEINEEKVQLMLKEVEEFCLYDMLFISPYQFTYKDKYYHLDKTQFSHLEFKDNHAFITIDGETSVVTNPLMLEDLKIQL